MRGPESVQTPTEPQRIDSTAARQGVALGHMRYVLGVSLALGVAALAILYFWYF